MKHYALLLAAEFTTSAFAGTIASPYSVGKWQGFKNAAVSYTFDDNTPNQYAKAVPMFNAKGWKVTLFTVTSWVSNWTNVKNAANSGHEIGSHTVTHRSLGSLSTTDQTSECSNSKNAIQSNTGKSCQTIAYPNCSVGSTSIIGTYYLAGRTCSGQIVPATPTDFFQISSIICGSAGSVNSASAMQSKVDSANSSGGWCVFLIHAIDNDSGYSPLSSAVLQTNVNYVATNSSRFWVQSFGAVVKYIKERNAVNVSQTASTATTLTVHVSDPLDSNVYNVPVTIRRPLPTGWTTAHCTKNGATIASSIVTVNNVKNIQFDVVPDTGDVVIVQN